MGEYLFVRTFFTAMSLLGDHTKVKDLRAPLASPCEEEGGKIFGSQQISSGVEIVPMVPNRTRNHRDPVENSKTDPPPGFLSHPRHRVH